MTLAALLALLLSGCALSQTPSGSVSTVTVTATPPTPIGAVPPRSAERTTPIADAADRSTYRAITDRQFALMMKDPNAYIGVRIIVCATVTQFDSLTGRAEFRADVKGQPGPNSVNALVGAADPSILDNVVKGDNLTMFVVVEGTKTYPTRFGQEPVPSFTVYILETFNHRTWPGK